MEKSAQLIELREQIKKLTYQAGSLPAVIINQGRGDVGTIGIRLEKLKQQERELVAQMSEEELRGAEMKAELQATQSEEDNKKALKKTLTISGIIAGILLLTTTVIIIIKKRKK